MEQAQLLREIVPNPRAHHRECAALHSHGLTGPTEPPSQQSEGIGYLGSPTLADRDLLGRRVQR